MSSSKKPDQRYHDDDGLSHRKVSWNNHSNRLSRETKQHKQFSHASSTGGTAGSVASGYWGSVRRDDPDLKSFGRKAEIDRKTKKSQYISGIDVSGYNMEAENSMPMERFLKYESRMDKFMQQKK